MEKRTQNENGGALKIVVTGPESVGKTELSKALAGHYNCSWVPEYARSYIGGIKRKYTLEDVLHIASVQMEETTKPANGMIIFDTWLIITKVWLDIVFHARNDRLEKMIRSKPVDLFLLCKPDIPWYPDTVRENGGETRNILYNRYLNEIEKEGYPYRIVAGTGETRLESAVSGIENFKKIKT